MITLANIRKAIYCLNKRLDLLEGGEYSNTVTELSNKVATLESLLDDDAQNPTAAIDKFNEIVAFLDSINNTETLQELLRDVIQQSYQQNYVTVPTYASLPATGSADTIYRVSNYNGSTNQIDTTSYSEYVWNNSDYTLLCVKSQMSEVFDISAYHATGGTLATYSDLSASLDSNNGGGVPQSFQKGGMRIQFVRTSDNKYVQARCMAQNFTTDVTQWQGVDDVPTAGSDNLVKGDGILTHEIQLEETTSWNNLNEFLGWNGSSSISYSPSQDNRHKVIPVKGGDVIVVSHIHDSVALYLQIVKTYTQPKAGVSSTVAYDFATGENSRIVQRNGTVYTITVPSDGKYVILSSKRLGEALSPSMFTINGFDVLKGGRCSVGEIENRDVKDDIVICHGYNATAQITSPFTLRSGRKYKISFVASSNQSGKIRIRNGNYLRLAYGNSIVDGTNASGQSYTLDFNAESGGYVDAPGYCIFSPQEDNILLISHRMLPESELIVQVKEIEQDFIKLLEDNSKLLADIKDIKSWQVENMLLGGKFIGDPEATITYMLNHVYDDDGNCYVGTFQSRTMKRETDPKDYSTGFIYFNPANPEKTSEFIASLNTGDHVFSNNDTASYLEMSVVGLVGNTLRCLMRVNGNIAYKDYDLQTKTFETYCHHCKTVINDIEYDLNVSNAETIVGLLNLTKYSTETMVSFTGNPIKIDDYWYEEFNFSWSHSIFRTQDFITWEFVTEIPYPYLSDEAQLCYVYDRLYVEVVGNIDRRENGYFSAIMYYDLTLGTWSTIKYLEDYGQDVGAMAEVDGKIYLLESRLKKRYPDDPTAIYVKDDIYTNNIRKARSRKTIFVFDRDLNIINQVELNLRRVINTCHFGTKAGCMYAFFGTDPKHITDEGGRETGMYSYVDVRYLDY